MSKDAFKQRENALESEFFHNVDKKLLKNLQAKMSGDTQRQRLAEAIGVSDKELLDELSELGVSAEAVIAISLVPAVLVAWADGKVDEKEQASVLKAATESGISNTSPAGLLLNHWLKNKPDPKLALTWQHYAKAVTDKIGADARATMRNEIFERARTVAKASGGMLGIGSISAAEKRVIAELETAFDLK